MKTVYLILFSGVLALFSVMLTLDRIQINSRYSALGLRMNEKNKIIRENETQFHHTLAEKNSEILDLKQRFHFVTEVLAPLPPVLKKQTKEKLPSGQEQILGKSSIPPAAPIPPFAQLTDDRADLRMVETLAGQLEENPPSPAQLRKLFLTYLASDSRLPDALRVHPGDERVIDRNAAIFEELCRRSRLTPETSLQWDMNNLTRRIVINIPPPPGSAGTPATVEFTAGNQHFRTGSAVIQDAPVSTVFPFDTVSLPKNGTLDLLLAMHEVPVGGLYLHKISVVCNDPAISEFLLEYDLPDTPETPEQPGKENGTTEKTPRPYRLQAVSLSGGAAVVSAVSGKIQTFRAPLVNGKGILLVFGDRVFLPERIIVMPFRRDGSFSPMPGSGKAH